MNPYFMMAGVFTLLAGLMAIDVALAQVGQVPVFAGIRWLRVHLVTLGIGTELLFGLVPMVARGRLEGGTTSWGRFLLLNGGILALLIGLPSVNKMAVYAGGTLVFLAAALLIDDVRRALPSAARVGGETGGRPSGKWFYVTGFAYFLVGVTVGTGVLFGWAGPLRIVTPLEAHIHANTWGLMSLSFAGLLVDLLPRWAGRELAWPGAVRPIYWMMTLGAAGLVAGPWTGLAVITAPGLILHVASTLWLLSLVVASVRGTSMVREPGVWHLVTAYAWIIAPLTAAPMVMLQVEWFPGAAVEALAPQAMVYGWLLQVAIAVLPFALRRQLLRDEHARLGGSWFTLGALHGGAILLWLSIFAIDARGPLSAGAYVLWAVAIAAAGLDVWGIVGQRPGADTDADASETGTPALAR